MTLLVEGVTGYPYGFFRHFSAQVPRPTVSSILFFGPSLKKNVKQLDRNEDFTRCQVRFMRILPMDNGKGRCPKGESTAI